MNPNESKCIQVSPGAYKRIQVRPSESPPSPQSSYPAGAGLMDTYRGLSQVTILTAYSTGNYSIADEFYLIGIWPGHPETRTKKRTMESRISGKKLGGFFLTPEARFLLKIWILLQKWTPWALYSIRYNIQLYFSFWTSRKISIKKSKHQTTRRPASPADG